MDFSAYSIFLCFISLISDFGYSCVTAPEIKRKSFSTHSPSKTYMREIPNKYLSVSLLFHRKTLRNHL